VVSDPSSLQQPEATTGWRRHVRRALVLLIGGALIIAGVVMLILPGPAFVVIPAGLAVLSTEFAVARRWRDSLVHFVRRRYRQARTRRRARPITERPPTADPLRERPM
jgi:uncharacterized protein (TIGR02611 family)